MLEELMKGTGKKPFVFTVSRLTDKTIWPYCPIPNATGIFIPGADNRYKTIILFNYATAQGGSPLYFANIKEDNSVTWHKYKTEQEINNELAKKIIVNVRLKEIGWHSSTDGMFFSDPLSIDIQMQEVLNACLGTWGGISKETKILPFVSNNGINIGIMSNTNEFLDRSFCEVYILYR